MLDNLHRKQILRQKRGQMENFTLALFIGWIFMMGCFAAMYFMDKAVKKADAERASVAEQTKPQRR